MPFVLTDRHIEEFHTLGYTVFEQILPPSLIADLRRVTDEARDLAREQSGPQTQRLQPVADFDLDQQPFIDYGSLPELVDAIHGVLSPAHNHGDLDHLGVLLEPADLPYCTHWHRDWRDNIYGLDLERWEKDYRDPNLFNQVNCALYEDSCTWVVPGSHLRRDLPQEVARFPDRPIDGPELENRSLEEREQCCLEYVLSMPGARQLHLAAGDFCLYRSILWHIGNYVPYRRRATIHDAAYTDAFMEWMQREITAANERVAAGASMSNPNELG